MTDTSPTAERQDLIDTAAGSAAGVWLRLQRTTRDPEDPDSWRAAVMAALAVLRHPHDAVRRAGQDALVADASPVNDSLSTMPSALVVWQAMIDALVGPTREEILATLITSRFGADDTRGLTGIGRDEAFRLARRWLREL
jgi:hypothetical protein